MSKCVKCKAEVEIQNGVCPECGAKQGIPLKYQWGCMVTFLVMIFLMGYCGIRSESKAAADSQANAKEAAIAYMYDKYATESTRRVDVYNCTYNELGWWQAMGVLEMKEVYGVVLKSRFILKLQYNGGMEGGYTVIEEDVGKLK